MARQMALNRVSSWLAPLLSVALGMTIGAAFWGASAVPAQAQPPARELLNSERITAEFGSYGIEVLEQDSDARVSNLYSHTVDQRVCRTFAVVRYRRIDPAFRQEHAAIVAGGSIGAVFAAAGWEVRKTHLEYGIVTATSRLASLMRIEPGTPLALHIYALDVAKSGRTLEYAVLAEIHHPDYLTRDDLVGIYGRVDEGSRPGLVAEVTATMQAAISRER
jgi:hypothetical protein